MRGERADPISYMEAGGTTGGFRIIETQRPIKLMNIQRGIIQFALIDHHFKEYTYSTVKKSGKTTVTSAVARWVAETFGAFTEVYCLANDLEQAKGRIFNGVLHSLELEPEWNPNKRELCDAQGNIIWQHRERALNFIPTRSTLKAVSNDYKGEAGSNPVATFWSELWGYEHEDDIRLWGEMRPVLTRGWSFRWVETYAGFADKPGVFYDRYEAGIKENKGAKRLNCHTFADSSGLSYWPGCVGLTPTPNDGSEFLNQGADCRDDDEVYGMPRYEDVSTIWSPSWARECDCARNGCGLRGCTDHLGPGLPLFVNEDASLFTYWDEDERARRMPWQDGEIGRQYYVAEYALEPEEKVADRFHKNKWISTQEAFIQIEWWDGCADDIPSLDHVREDGSQPGKRVPCVLGVDAAVSDDCIALVLVSRHPDPTRYDHVAVRKVLILYPPKHGQFDYGAEGGLKQTVREWCLNYNVLQIAYDAYQLHDVMTTFRNEGLAWCREFSQGADRMEADKALQQSIVQRSIAWPRDAIGNWHFNELREHLQHADRKIAPNEDTKLRLVKRTKGSKIDGTVALSMARYECSRLYMSAA